MEGALPAGTRVVTPAPAPAWEGPRRLPTQTARWSAVVQACGWQDRSRLYQLPDGRELLVPLVGWARGRVLASWPYGWGNGGALASDGRLTAADVRLVTADLARLGALRCSIVPAPDEEVWQAAAGLAQASTPYVTHVLDLAGGLAGLERGYSSNVRRSIRRAQAAGLEVVRDTTGALLPEFAHLHRLSAQRWAATAGRSALLARLQQRLSEPPSRLGAAVRGLGSGLVVWMAYVAGRPAAAIVVLTGSETVVYWRGAMDRELAGRTHANALLHHLALQEAVAQGARRYSFGESDEGSALADYKAKFGARPVRWSAYHLERVPLTAAGARAHAGYASASRLPSQLRARGAPLR